MVSKITNQTIYLHNFEENEKIKLIWIIKIYMLQNHLKSNL